MADCFWFHQGKCQLFTMPEDMVYGILAQTPQAREDIQNCGTKCPDVDLAFIAFAQDPRTLVEPSDQVTEREMRRVNRYRDIITLITRPKGDS